MYCGHAAEAGENAASIEVVNILAAIVPAYLGKENAPLHPFGQRLCRLYETLGLTSETATKWYAESSHGARFRQATQCSSDGLHHRYSRDFVVAVLQSSTTLAASATIVGTLNSSADAPSLTWLDELPDPSAHSLRCCFYANITHVSARVLIAEVLESMELYARATEFCQAELACPYNKNLSSRCRAGELRYSALKHSSDLLLHQEGASGDATRCWSNRRSASLLLMRRPRYRLRQSSCSLQPCPSRSGWHTAERANRPGRRDGSSSPM